MKIDWNTIFNILIFLPVVIRMAAYFGVKSQNRQVQLLSERALIIAQAMEETNLSPTAKKEEAIRRLTKFAKEVAIKVSDDQVDDYIESSVNILRQMGVKPFTNLEEGETIEFEQPIIETKG